MNTNYGMTIEEIRTSVTMALCKSCTTEDKHTIMKIEDDVKKQCDIIGEHLGNKFLFVCMRDAEECMTNKNKMTDLFKKFEIVGPRFSAEIKDSEMESLLEDHEEN
tara:strand:+ start:438 stop:755 length:318 start_codon:yes stop_codon:yes gene_type:complete